MQQPHETISVALKIIILRNDTCLNMTLLIPGKCNYYCTFTRYTVSKLFYSGPKVTYSVTDNLLTKITQVTQTIFKKQSFSYLKKLELILCE